MILDTLKNHCRYHALHPLFKAAFEFLESPQSRALPAGRHAIDGDRLFAVVVRDNGKGPAGARLEIHKNYIDIQFEVSGTDLMGYRPTAECVNVAVPYDAEKDLGFFSDPSDTWVTLKPEMFAVFHPEDAHAPLGGQGPLHKIVVKVKM
ncbi:MAG: YhcH/YjgK/YiaL family protein [Fibrobacterota bacterium]